MKICQCCGAHASADAPHCARCGEGSWTIVAISTADVVAAFAAPPAPIPSVIAAPDDAVEPVREAPPSVAPIPPAAPPARKKHR